VPGEFGNLELVDSSHQQLKGYASSRQPQKFQYESVYSQLKPQKSVQHSGLLHGDTTEHDNHIHTHKPKTEYLTGQTTIPASDTNDGYKPSENFSAKIPASVYREGARFNQVLDVPAEKGKKNYYNGLAEAHYEHGHLLGVPAHMVNGKMTSHLDHEIDLQLHKTK
jgi:hypothetical protein